MKTFKYLFVCFIVFTSCKSAKTITSNNVVLENLSARKVAKKHNAIAFNKETIDARLKVKYQDSKENIGFSVHMKIKKDEVIWLKGTKLITIFKAKITPNKVSFYSPYKKNYFEGDFTMLKELLGVDVTFNQLQNMLIGEAMLDLTSQRQEVEIINASYRLSPKKQPILFDLFFDVNPNHYKLNQQSLVNSVKEQRLDIIYPNYNVTNKVVFPAKVAIRGKNKNKFTKIDLAYKSVEFNNKLNVSFRIPTGYKEIKL